MSDPEIEALKQKRATLVEKLKRLESGEMNCEERKGDGRQAQAITRTKAFIAGIDKELKGGKVT